jgi:hypothetical protein
VARPPRSPWRIALVVGAVVVVAAVLAVALVHLAERAVDRFLNGLADNYRAERTVDRYFGALEQGKQQVAAANACSGFAPALPRVTSHHTDGAVLHREHRRQTATVPVTLVLADGTSVDETAKVEQHGDSWLLCGLEPAPGVRR